MKYFFLFFACCFSNWLAAQTIQNTIQYNGTTRTFNIYLPANYSTSQPCPIVLNLHGYGSSAYQQASLSNMNNVADTAGFIVVYPEGLPDGSGLRQWNSGYGTGVDDVGFINLVLDFTAANYVVNQQKIYSTGLSNGGIMSNTLACELSGRIAAIAGVAGTMSWLQYSSCTNAASIPVMHIHGTSDLIVPYNGNTALLGVTTLVNHWRARNNLTTNNTTTAYPNVNTTDGCYAELIAYETGSATPVHLIRVTNGGHTWPGSGFNLNGNVNMDIDASVEIWNFFQQFSSNYTHQTPLAAAAKGIENWRVLGQGQQLQWTQQEASQLHLSNALGQVVLEQKVAGTGQQTLLLPNLPKGIYWVSYQQAGQALQNFSFIKS